ncbi:MAG TPA: hypothetical protein VFN67_26430 [Polyangiales bacterium]|nr:hypothetical protein [Polyangiales bacterium]
MGVESFQVEILSDASSADVRNALLSLRGACQGPDDEGFSQLVVRDETHVLELELWLSEKPRRVVLGTTVCHPESVLSALKTVVDVLRTQASVKGLRILDEPPPPHPADFPPGNLDDWPTSLEQAYLQKRRLWVADFGDTTAASTSKEAAQAMLQGFRRKQPDPG